MVESQFKFQVYKNINFSIVCLQDYHWRRDKLLTLVFLGFSGGSDGKESTCIVEDLGSISGLEGLPGRGHDNP